MTNVKEIAGTKPYPVGCAWHVDAENVNGDGRIQLMAACTSGMPDGCLGVPVIYPLPLDSGFLMDAHLDGHYPEVAAKRSALRD